MVDALVGLPQLLLDRALTRSPHVSLGKSGSESKFRRGHGNLDRSADTATLTTRIERSRERPAETERNEEMVPDTEAVCQTSEAAVDSVGDVYEKIKDRPEKEVASMTAWKRYQRLVALMESRGGEFNRKSVIEAIFRGSDLVYASH